MFSSYKKSLGQLRIERKIQKILFNEFEKNNIFNNQNIFISSITPNISQNFKNLNIYIDISNVETKNKKEIVDFLNKKYLFIIKDLIAKTINLKYIPDIKFFLDNSNEKIFKINNILENEKKKMKKNNK